MHSPRPERAARAVALVEPDEDTRACVAQALEGAGFQIVCRCASAVECSEQLPSDFDIAAILVGSDEDLAASESEVKRLREHFTRHKIIAVGLHRACRGARHAPNSSEDVREASGLARALEWMLLELQEQLPSAGRPEAARGADSPDVRSHIKALLKGVRSFDQEPPA